MPEDKIFLDTNILVYAHDRSAGQKHETARQTVLDLWESGLGTLSTQVLQEFYVTVTSKVPKPLGAQAAGEIIKGLLKWEVVVNDGESILAAIALQRQLRYSFWDAMIVQAALEVKASLLLSEDLSDGQKIDGLTIRNPF